MLRPLTLAAAAAVAAPAWAQTGPPRPAPVVPLNGPADPDRFPSPTALLADTALEQTQAGAGGPGGGGGGGPNNSGPGGTSTPAGSGTSTNPAGGDSGPRFDEQGRFLFKNVPNVRPTQRSGMFSILPTGRGYYSLADAIRGVEREAFPKFPFPPFTTSTLSFFDADYRYVDAKDYNPDFWESLKRVRIGDNFLLSTGGQTWFRYEHEAHARETNTRSDVYTLYRVRPYVDVWYQDQFRFFIEGIFADSVWQDLAPRQNDINRADIQNMFVEAKLFDVMDKPFYLRGGRQELQYGSQRLIGTPDWANTRRTFDAVKLHRTGEKWDYDILWAKPVIQDNYRLDSSDPKQNLALSWLTYRPKKGTAVDAYYIFTDNRNTINQLGVDRGQYSLHTFGSRLSGEEANGFLYDFEGAMQLGTRGNSLRQPGQSEVIAGFGTAGVGYHAKDLPFNPTAWIYYDYASGDRNPSAGTTSTFNQLFPFGHYYLGWLDAVGRQNIHDLNLSLTLYPVPWLTTWFQVHNFWLASNKDALYNAAGAAIRRDASGRSGNFVGTELDFIFNFHLNKRTDLLTGYSCLFGGEFFRNTARLNPGNFSNNSNFSYVSLSYRW